MYFGLLKQVVDVIENVSKVASPTVPDDSYDDTVARMFSAEEYYIRKQKQMKQEKIKHSLVAVATALAVAGEIAIRVKNRK